MLPQTERGKRMIDQSAPLTYLLKPTQPVVHRFAYIGVPHDAATSLGNPGGRFGPQALPEALRGVFGWRLQGGRLAGQDAGVIALAAGYLPLVAGGDHGVTYPAVKALHDHIPGRVGLIQLDAHCDLMDYSER